MRTAAAACLAILLVAPALAAGASGRPVLEQHQGRFFRWAAPKGWSMQETTNGIDLGAPDGETLVSHATERALAEATVRRIGRVRLHPMRRAVYRRIPNLHRERTHP
jgi:hypothetical protein